MHAVSSISRIWSRPLLFKSVASSSVASSTFLVELYVDIKSPLSYLAIKPAMQMQDDYHCRVRLKPYDLSYIKMGISSSHNPNDPKRIPPDENADRRAKMFYTVARQYAQAQGLKIRGPHSLMKSTQANMGILWAAKEGKEVEYTLAVCGAAWPSGWRQYDIQDISLLKHTMKQSGISDQHISGFDEYVTTGAGAQDLSTCMTEADESGHVGCPHFVFWEPDGKRIGIFGREHIGLIRHKMHAQGLAKNEHVNPDICHYWVEPSRKSDF